MNGKNNALGIDKCDYDYVIALAGNPNVGKSTIFNCLTGMHQHTGNWPGKTVASAFGKCEYKDSSYLFVDLPGTYSLMAHSAEEEVARDYMCFGEPDITVVVCDATCIEHNLNLVLQTMEITKNVIVCVNLLDEAKRKKITIDLKQLSRLLHVPVIGTSATKKDGISELLDTIHNMSLNANYANPVTYPKRIETAINSLLPTLAELLPASINHRWAAIRLLDQDKALISAMQEYLYPETLAACDLNPDATIIEEIKDNEETALYSTNLGNVLKKAYTILSENSITEIEIKDEIVSAILSTAEKISETVTTLEEDGGHRLDRKIDKVLTSRTFGIPVMLVLLLVIFWITITGANYPSAVLYDGLFFLGDKASVFLLSINTPVWLEGLLIGGIYRVLAWVISVMLPPMAIFFPLFTLLEDLGYLPRVAFNLDHSFKKAQACGKQALTMAMGFGCNAVGIIGCRIIDSPRERLIAILTNNFVPCNGRFPTIISILTMFFVFGIGGIEGSLLSTLLLTSIIVFGVIMTLLISRLLSSTILKGIPSSFTLELPPYRKPQIGKVILRSVFDRTLFVLGRAIAVAAPAGLVIWVFANINIGDSSLLSHCTNFLDPFASLMGLDGSILMAFILGFPANEIVVPILLMTYLSEGTILEMENTVQLKNLLVDNGWTIKTALCFLTFCLLHWPCSTTIITIMKETKSKLWTLISFLLPTICGIALCCLINLAFSFF